jgi:hypothetical protein
VRTCVRACVPIISRAQVLPASVDAGCFKDARVWVGGEPNQNSDRALYVLHKIQGLAGSVQVRPGLFCGTDLAAASAAVSEAKASMSDFKFVVGAVSWRVDPATLEVDIGDTWFKADGDGVPPLVLLSGVVAAGSTHEADRTQPGRSSGVRVRVVRERGCGACSARLSGRRLGARDARDGGRVRGARERALGVHRVPPLRQ